ncbi:MAG: IGHMBP2 family helicase, partial [Cytophagales bacterium]|nr:IGHMBP2 family helicase [Cytophagales bacterium]
IEEHIMSAVLESADAITCTLVGATHYTINHLKFKTVVIDEAGQAMEPATWIPITKAEKVVLAGDPFQLPPTVKGTAAAKAGLGTSLLEVCIKNGLKSSLLDTQYRMNATIMGFSNLWFYQNKLTAHPSAIDQALDEFPLEFIDTAGCSYDEEINPSTVSFFNKGEADILQKHLQNLRQSHPEPLSFGLISPYREQVRYLETLLGNLPHTDIQTVDGFQGNEKDVIYISLVRSNDKGEIGFLMDYRRMNVAMTRARKKLVIIGDSATIGQDKFYKAFLEYAEKHGQYSSAWEWVGW